MVVVEANAIRRNDEVAVSTFKLWLPVNSYLRNSLTPPPSRTPEDMQQLTKWIEEYKRLNDNQLQVKGKGRVATLNKRETRTEDFPRKQKQDPRF